MALTMTDVRLDDSRLPTSLPHQPPLVSFIALLGRLARTNPQVFVTVRSGSVLLVRTPDTPAAPARRALDRGHEPAPGGGRLPFMRRACRSCAGAEVQTVDPSVGQDFVDRVRSTGRLPEMYSDPPRAQVRFSATIFRGHRTYPGTPPVKATPARVGSAQHSVCELDNRQGRWDRGICGWDNGLTDLGGGAGVSRRCPGHAGSSKGLRRGPSGRLVA
jgi:hypothetical protein